MNMKLLQVYSLYFMESDYEKMTVTYKNEYGKVENQTFHRDEDITLPASLVPIHILLKTWGDDELTIAPHILSEFKLGMDGRHSYYAEIKDHKFEQFYVYDDKNDEFIYRHNGDIHYVVPEEERFQDLVCDNHYSVLLPIQRKLETLLERLYK
ncbi:hypothetical protein D8768_16200 [Enterobacter hormaechei]|uniref:hypothetical protein n=1 Tax=Enterobacter hormaechei TaxID=158836 RepID=UPI0012F7DAFF|nr:hypothetical protein [Enterobacter hormaechei]QGU37368.1 hypothetical protein D8768_16200 [Enterobacter hormaechei]